MNRIALNTIVIAPALVALATGCAATEKATSGSSLAAGSSAVTTPTKTKAAPPTPADFIVGVIITEQKCFGSAGCSFHYTINPQYISAKPLPDKTTVIYTVTGGDQDQVGNFTIDAHGTATFDREESIDGQEGAVLKATVTQVIPGR